MSGLSQRIVLSLLPKNGEQALQLLQRDREADVLIELRADFLSAGELERALRSYDGELLVAIRRPADGGGWAWSEGERIERLKQARELGVRWIDVESDAEWRPWFEEGAQQSTGWIVSDHGLPCAAEPLDQLWQQLRQLPVEGVKIVPVAQKLSDNAAIYALLESRTEADPELIAFAMGRPGSTSRLLSAMHGSPWHYAARELAQLTAPGQLTLESLRQIYRPFQISADTRLFGLLGAELSRSPSPAMHQAEYDAQGIDARYLPFESASFEHFVEALNNGSLGGPIAVGVTMPHKQSAARWVNRLDPWAERTGAVNTLTREGDHWVGWNTDAPAAVEWAQGVLGDLSGTRVRVLGAGGTAQALAASYRHAGAQVELYARDSKKSSEAASQVGVQSFVWESREKGDWDLLVNATPLGADGQRWFSQESLTGQAVLDAVYRTGGTALSQDAARRGLAVWGGLDLLVAQGTRQFELMTGSAADAKRMRCAAESYLQSIDRPQRS